MADELRSHNVMRGTAEYVLQIGYVHGDVTVHLPPAADPVERAAWALARSIRTQWSAELNAWDLASAEPLAVRWRADWPELRGGGGPGGQMARMADVFLGLGHRRLVVLGGPGAGKSTLAVLLTLELAERCLTARHAPRDGGGGEVRPPVPVVLTLESWDPSREHFRGWLARRIAEDHPGLPRVDGDHPAARLVQDGLVLPVLDGLDELPAHRRSLVVREIDRALGEKDAVVLTSRTREYRAGEEAGAAIARAAVIEAQPVGLEDATAYLLRSAAPQVRRSWKLMLDAVDREPEGPVAQALTSPLMIWLARRGFQAPPADPLDLVRRPFPSREAVERYLLDLIIPAVFTRQPHSPDRLHAPSQWNPGRSRHWLAHLARHLTGRRTTEFAWWDLHRTALVRVMLLPALALVCLALSQVAAVARDWFVSSQAGDPMAGWGLELALTNGLVHAMAVWIAVDMWFGFRLGRPRRRANPFRIGAALRSAGRAASLGRGLKASAVVALPAGLFTAMVVGAHDARPYVVMVVCSTVLAPLVMVTIAAPSDTEDASTPDEVLGSERTAAWLSVGTVAVLIGVGQGAFGWYVYETVGAALARGVTAWFGAAAMLLLMSLWSRWLLAKGCLAIAGRVPWSLMEFLRDAHHGGLLQRSGGVYRFRHLRLQEHLADTERGDAPAALPYPRDARPSPYLRPPESAAASAPLPRFRDALAEFERSPLGSLKGWTVHHDTHGFSAEGRSRRLSLAHWPVISLPRGHGLHPFGRAGQLAGGRRSVPGHVRLRGADHAGPLAPAAPGAGAAPDPGAHRVQDGAPPRPAGLGGRAIRRRTQTHPPQAGHQGLRPARAAPARRARARAVLPRRRRVVLRPPPVNEGHRPGGRRRSPAELRRVPLAGAPGLPRAARRPGHRPYPQRGLGTGAYGGSDPGGARARRRHVRAAGRPARHGTGRRPGRPGRSGAAVAAAGGATAVNALSRAGWSRASPPAASTPGPPRTSPNTRPTSAAVSSAVGSTSAPSLATCSVRVRSRCSPRPWAPTA